MWIKSEYATNNLTLATFRACMSLSRYRTCVRLCYTQEVKYERHDLDQPARRS